MVGGGVLGALRQGGVHEGAWRKPTPCDHFAASFQAALDQKKSSRVDIPFDLHGAIASKALRASGLIDRGASYRRNGLLPQGVSETLSVSLAGRAIGFSSYRMTPRARVWATASEPSTIARTASDTGTWIFAAT